MERKPRISTRARKGMRQLLEMEYRSFEIASVLGVSAKSVRRWCAAGAPHRREDNGYLWIVGSQLAQWMDGLKRERVRLAEGEAFCVKCQRAVTMAGSIRKEPNMRKYILRGTCSICGGTVCRFVRD